jgi:hypothetical protein
LLHVRSEVKTDHSQWHCWPTVCASTVVESRVLKEPRLKEKKGRKKPLHGRRFQMRTGGEIRRIEAKTKRKIQID